jgi:hypothetical protein
VNIGLFILIISVLMIIASIWMTSERSAQRHSGENILKDEDIGQRPSTDFRALINEERREDRGKAIRDWITIGILLATFGALAKNCLAIISQVDEMRRVYEPIKISADATMREAIANERAWVGPTDAVIPEQPVIGQPVKVATAYINSGRSASSLYKAVATTRLTKSDWYSNPSCDKIRTIVNECFNSVPVASNSVAWPTTGGNGYRMSFPVSTEPNPNPPPEKFDQALQDGNDVFVVTGCFAYLTAGALHHTAFCFYAEPGKIQTNVSLYICNCGNAAD